MNRRQVVLGGSISFALINNVSAQRRGNSAPQILTSELTGGEVDISGSDLVLTNQHIDDADGSEHFHFQVDNGGQFDIYFWPTTSGDAGAFTEANVNMFLSLLPNAEMIGSDQYADGGWYAFDVGNIGYYEYQLGAYEGHDLLILFNAAPDEFADVMEQAQAIQIDGLPPFLFTEESDILALAAARVASTPSSRSSRTTSSPSESNTRSSRSSSTSTSSGGDPVEAVLNHRSGFLESYDDFYAFLQTAADEASGNREVEDAFAAMVNIAFGWQQYPVEAAEIVFSAEHSELEAVYLDWADGVADMGVTFEQFYMGDASVDDFLNVYDAWGVIDDELLAILNTFAARTHRRITSSREFGDQLRASARAQ